VKMQEAVVKMQQEEEKLGMLQQGPLNFPHSDRKDFLEMPVGRRKDWSGRRDLNSGPPAPKAGALPGCATPRHELLYSF
jgi:hypothetical protein